jgi:hypothetical protein
MLLQLDPAVRDGQMFGELPLGQPRLVCLRVKVFRIHMAVDRSRPTPRSQALRALAIMKADATKGP